MASNRTSVSGTAASTLLPDAVSTSNYDAGNRQLGFGARTMTYDNNGNLATLTLGADTTQYSWDQRNRLTGLTGPGLAASFVYDGIGRRTSKTANTILHSSSMMESTSRGRSWLAHQQTIFEDGRWTNRSAAVEANTTWQTRWGPRSP